MTEFLTPKQLAARLGVSVRFVHLLIGTGDLAAFRIGPKAFRIAVTDAENFIASRRTGITS